MLSLFVQVTFVPFLTDIFVGLNAMSLIATLLVCDAVLLALCSAAV
jgi:predicted nucleic acid-binding protein